MQEFGPYGIDVEVKWLQIVYDSDVAVIKNHDTDLRSSTHAILVRAGISESLNPHVDQGTRVAPLCAGCRDMTPWTGTKRQRFFERSRKRASNRLSLQYQELCFRESLG